ncbi:hypothetical protein [Cerasicoccus frondis]|uniref:hypothetical protein n=1 Tax=Cerasicoccus frondis TaxID=490090 RepID=UPI0028526C0B|nr:hypothetical protein [Cerasicoccus frondis]
MSKQYHMKGDGYYNAHSAPQLASINDCLPWLLNSLEDLQLPQDKQIRTLDVGCSQGGNSVEMLQQLIPSLRERGAASIQPSLADLPSNDFNSVFAKLFPGGVNILGDDVLPAVIGGSAYERLAPANSLHVVTTFNMLGWRKDKPVGPLHNTVGAFLPTPYAKPEQGAEINPDEVAAVHAQAAGDLVSFFKCRAEELVSGGKMLVQIFGRNDEDGSVAHGWLDALNDVIRAMIAEGKCTQQALDDFIFPVVWRKLDELLEPLTTNDELRRAFTIERSASWEVPVDFNQRYAESGDVLKWAHEYMEVFRAVTETTLAHLFPEADRTQRLEEVYQRIVQLFAHDPVRYQFHYYSIAVLVTRN